MTMYPAVKETLKHQDQCPICGANWKELEDSLSESVGSENYQTALCIIFNCRVCRARFEEELAP